MARKRQDHESSWTDFGEVTDAAPGHLFSFILSACVACLLMPVCTHAQTRTHTHTHTWDTSHAHCVGPVAATLPPPLSSTGAPAAWTRETRLPASRTIFAVQLLRCAIRVSLLQAGLQRDARQRPLVSVPASVETNIRRGPLPHTHCSSGSRLRIPGPEKPGEPGSHPPGPRARPVHHG